MLFTLCLAWFFILPFRSLTFLFRGVLDLGAPEKNYHPEVQICSTLLNPTEEQRILFSYRSLGETCE